MSNSADVESYIAAFPDDVQGILRRIGQLIREIAPDAAEGIAYGMPAYKLNGKPLVYFGGYARHIGLYATPTGHEAFQADLAGYKQGKGSVQFPLNQPIPYELIDRIVRFRVAEVSGIQTPTSPEPGI